MRVPRIDPKAIGERLRRLRRKRGWTSRHVARLTQINGATLSLLEHGRRVPQLWHLIGLAVVYRRSLEYLLFGLPKRGQLYQWAKKNDPAERAASSGGSARQSAPAGAEPPCKTGAGCVDTAPPLRG